MFSVKIERVKSGDLVPTSLDPRHADGTIVAENLKEIGATEGESWYASLLFERGKGRQRVRTIRLARRVGESLPGLLADLGADFWVDARKLRNLQILLRAGRFVILRGPSGTGKTTLAERLVAAMGFVESIEVDVGVVSEPKQFFGEESASHGTTTFRPSALTQFLDRAAAYECEHHPARATHLIRLDEINRVHPSLFSAAFNGLFDDGRSVTITTSDGPRVIALPICTAAIGTMNPNRPEFGGTYAIDASTLNRAYVEDLGYPPKAFEVDLLVGRLIRGYALTLERDDAVRIVEAATALRAAAARQQLTLAPSPRNTLDCALLVANGVPVGEAMVDVLLNPYEHRPNDEDSERKRAEMAIAAKIHDVGSVLAPSGMQS